MAATKAKREYAVVTYYGDLEGPLTLKEAYGSINDYYAESKKKPQAFKLVPVEVEFTPAKVVIK